jgi:uncharacterized ubiquitin-like protein YukD
MSQFKQQKRYFKNENYVGDASEEDLKHYNHSERRKIIKQLLKDEKIEIKTLIGTIKVTNKYRVQHNKERHSFKVWSERVNKAIEAGRSIKRYNDENNYNNYRHQMEIYDARYRNLLDEIFGKEQAEIEYNKYMKRVEKRADKTLNK